MIAWNLAQTAAQGQTDGRPIPRRSASPPAFPPRPRAQVETRPLFSESGLEDVEASLLAIKSCPPRLAPPPATQPGSLPRQQRSKGSQERDTVPISDRSVVLGPGAPPGSAARAQLSSVTAADVIDPFPEFPGVPAWMIRRDAAAGTPSGGTLQGIPIVASSVSTARKGRVMPPGSARILDVHLRPACTDPSPGLPQAIIPGSSARVARLSFGSAPTGAVPASSSRTNPSSRTAAANANYDVSEAETDHEPVLDPLSEAVHNPYALHNAINSRFTSTNPNTTPKRLHVPILTNPFSVSVTRNAATMSATSASAVAGASSAGPFLPLFEKENKYRKNQKKNANRKAKKAAAKAETNDTFYQGDDGDDAIPTNALPDNPAMNQPAGTPAKDKDKMKADDAIPVTSANGIPASTSSRGKGKVAATNTGSFAASISAAANWVKPSSSSTMTPEETQTMAASFMAKFGKNKERHRAVSPPRQTTQYTAEEKYQYVIAGMLKSQGVVSNVKTRTQVRREGPNPAILRTEGGREMPELGKQLSDVVVAHNEALEAKKKEMEGKEKADAGAKKINDDALEMSDEQLIDHLLIRNSSLPQLLAVVEQIDRRIISAQSERDVARPLVSALSEVSRLSLLLESLKEQKVLVQKEISLLKVEERAHRSFIRENTTFDGRRGRMGMRQGCAVPMDDPPVAPSMDDIEPCALGGDFEDEGGDNEEVNLGKWAEP